MVTRISALLVSLFFLPFSSFANPYLVKPGERPASLRIATCAVSGGFVHLYTAMDNNLFDKYGLKLEHIYIRGSAPALAALSGDEIQFVYCAADGTIPGLATGVDAKLVASPLVKLPYVLVTRKEIRRPEDLKGKSLGVTRPGDLSARLSGAVVKKFGLNPDKAKAAIAKAMRVKNEDALQSSYNVYAKEIVDRTMMVPGRAVAEAVDLAREGGTNVRKKPEELYDNSFVLNLEKSGFLKEIWGSENYKR